MVMLACNSETQVTHADKLSWRATPDVTQNCPPDHFSRELHVDICNSSGSNEREYNPSEGSTGAVGDLMIVWMKNSRESSARDAKVVMWSRKSSCLRRHMKVKAVPTLAHSTQDVMVELECLACKRMQSVMWKTMVRSKLQVNRSYQQAMSQYTVQSSEQQQEGIYKWGIQRGVLTISAKSSIRWTWKWCKDIFQKPFS